MKLCMFRPKGQRPDPRLARADRGRPRDPARGTNAAVVLHRRRPRARACRVPAGRDRAAAACAAPAVGSRLLRLRAAREDGAGCTRPRGAGGVVPDPCLLLLEPERDLRAGGGDPVPRGHRGARLRARGRRSDRRRRRDRRLHGHERLVGAGPPAGGDEGRARARQGQGLRDEPRADRRHPGRVRRLLRDDGRPRQWRGAIAAATSPTCTTRGRRSSPTPARNTELHAGDILGSGTVGTGCILEHGDGRWLQPGDVVELEVEGIGTLRNTVGPR